MRPPRDAGFTLLEMLVVVAILGITGSIILSRGPVRSARQEVRAGAAILSGALRGARSQAIATDRAVAFTFDPVARAWRVDAAAPHVLPGGLAVAASPAGIVFSPQGGSTGGRIALASGSIRAEIGVDWLTGRVSVSDGR